MILQWASAGPLAQVLFCLACQRSLQPSDPAQKNAVGCSFAALVQLKHEMVSSHKEGRAALLQSCLCACGDEQVRWQATLAQRTCLQTP